MRKRTSVGLDIGSSAVRAAEVVIDGKRAELRRFAQVGLAPGAVVEGEVRDADAVSAAIKRLWGDGGFKSRQVVVGVSSQRAMVRVLEMPGTLGKDLRSALRYEIGDVLPIPLEQAVFDFEILGPGRPNSDGGPTTQVLVVVAQKDIVRDEIEVVRKAGLRPRAVDASALALLRAVPLPGEGEMDAVVSLGAQLAVVAVRQGGVPRFIRTTALGADVESPARTGVVARVSPGAVKDHPEERSPAPRTETAVEEVRSSIEYFLSHAHGARLDRVSVTGGSALTPGLKERMASVLGVPVGPAGLVAQADGDVLGLAEEQLAEAGLRWTAAVGLALWGTEGSQSPNLIPAEVAERARQRQTIAMAGAGVVVVAAGLGVLAYQKTTSIDNVKAQTTVAQQQAGALAQQIDKLAYVTRAADDMQARRALAAAALQSDVDWVGLQHRIEHALPGGVVVTAVNFTAAPPASPSSAPTAPPTANTATIVGNITMSGQTTGGLRSVASFERAMSRVKGLSAVWVSSNEITKGTDSFSVTGQVTSAALSNRAAKLPGGTK